MDQGTAQLLLRAVLVLAVPALWLLQERSGEDFMCPLY